MSRFNWSLFLIGIIFLTLRFTSGGSCYAQANSDPWLIVASGEKGTINIHTTREDLVQSFGDTNVVDKDVDVGEGETEPGTVVFPNDTERRIEVLWKDPDKKIAPKSATITGSKSRWHAAHGISLAASLEDLEAVNGRPFAVSFGTDEPGAILSWRGGLLDREFGNGQVFVTLGCTPSNGSRQNCPPRLGGNSDKPAIRKLRLRVSRITWEFLYTQ